MAGDGTRRLDPSGSGTSGSGTSGEVGPPTPTEAAAALAELGRLVLSQHPMESVLQRVAELAKSVFPGAQEVSVSLVRNERATTVVHTGLLAKDLDEGQYARGSGPCLDACRSGEAMQIDDASTEPRWADYTRVAVERGSGSSLSVPVPMQEYVSAALNLYGGPPHSFDASSLELATTFASYAGIALAHMYLYETTRQLAADMESAMRSRAVIDQAKGVLMAQRRCSAEQAFDLLVAASQRSNRKLRDVAQALVDSVADGPPRS